MTVELPVLPAELVGRVLLKGSAAYEMAWQRLNLRRVDRQPIAIGFCTTSGEVATLVRWAADRRLRVTPRGGGHCFAGRSSAGDVVIDLSAMSAVTVSGDLAEVEAGVRLGDLYRTLSARGLVLPAGCGATVGVVGLTLGGGLGLLGRLHGLTCDQLSAADVVLADGTMITCDQDRHADLFWALRGAGGGHFGVVARLMFRFIPEPEVTVFRLGWAPADAADLIAAWTQWAPAADPRLTAHLELSAPDDRRRPPTIGLVGGMVGDAATTRAAVRELGVRAGCEPVDQIFRLLAYATAKAVLGETASEPDDHSPAPAPRTADVGDRLEFHTSEFFDAPLPSTAVSELLDHLHADRRSGQARVLSFLPMGGAYNAIPTAATAFAHRHHRYLLEHIGSVAPDAPTAERRTAEAWAARSRDLVRPWGSGGVYPNFPDPRLDDWARAYWGPNHSRLLQVKQRYDPDNLFWAQQGVAGLRQNSQIAGGGHDAATRPDSP